jgi:hypothetical protein
MQELKIKDKHDDYKVLPVEKRSDNLEQEFHSLVTGEITFV